RVWDSDSRYKVTVKGAVIKDKAGNVMNQSKNWYFETVDMTTPFVLKDESLPVGESVRTDKTIKIVFSESVKPETVKISLNTVEVVQAPVITEDDTVFEWSPVLELNTEYTVKVLDGVEDKAGNVMKTEDGHEWLFKTSAYNIYPVVNFYKVLIPLTKEPLCDSAANAFNNSSNFEVIDKLTTLAVAGTITCDAGAKTVKFVPATQFAKDGNYTIKIKSNTQYSDSSTIGAVDLIMDFHFEMIIDDDFESGSAGWEMENNWEIGVPNYNAYSYKITTAKSGTKVLATGLTTEHRESASYSAKSKNKFVVEEYDQYYVEFWAYVGLENYMDPQCAMLVKIVEETTPKIESVAMTVWGGADLFGDYWINSAKQPNKAVRGKSVDNTYSFFDGVIEGVTTSSGKQFELWFLLHTDGGYAKAGIYLDDVKLYKTVF
ncbi:MAG TPA: Ig-like domain-containing protein, partial [bacterium]|nr:Ig-like domain-containing protein [bacterium]